MSRFDQAFEEVKAAAREWARKDDRQLSSARAIAGGYAELRWLEKDYIEERDGDHYR